MYLKLKNIGTLALHGRHPGEEWVVEADADSRPINQLWRKRLADEVKYDVRVIKIVEQCADEIRAPAPVVNPVYPPPDIGPVLDLFSRLEQRIAALEAKPQVVPAQAAKADQIAQQVVSIFEDKFAAVSKTLSDRIHKIELTIAEAI